MTEPQEPHVLLRSQIECPWCHDVIASVNRHDFNSCSCGATSIDGGLDYLRVAGDWVLTHDRDEVRALMHPITIAGPHNQASKVYALEVYKALWIASDRGTHPATTSDTLDVLRLRPERTGKATRQSMVVYLDLFVESGCVEKTRGAHGWVWKPLVPLVERSDAP